MKPSWVAIALALTATCIAGVWLELRPPAPASVPSAHNPWPTPERDPYERQWAVLRALRDEGLHAAARESGGKYVAEFNPHEESLIANSFKSLGRFSDLVVVGRALEGRSRLANAGQSISTYWTVNAVQTIKGPVTTEVLVRVPGGRITFDDGTEAELVPAGGEFGLVPGHEYALFLRHVPPDHVHLADDPARVIYEPFGISYGVFELTSGNGMVKSQARPGAAVRVAVEGESRAVFLERLPARALDAPQ